MSQIAIERVSPNTESEPSSFLHEIKTLTERVRERAFYLFHSRGRAEGFALDDWLRAERDLVWAPESDLVEKNGGFEVQIAVPGFEAKDVHLTACPDALFLRAESTHKHEESDGNVHFCEFGEKTLFRKLEMPLPIDVDKVSAHLDKGVLHITASKDAKEAAPEKEIVAA